MKVHGGRLLVKQIYQHYLSDCCSESLKKLANQLNHHQNLVSSLRPVPILISEAVMHFQERRDFITNKMIGKCLLDKEDFGLRRKRNGILKPFTKTKASPVSRKSRDHMILNQMFESFSTKVLFSFSAPPFSKTFYHFE